MATVAFWGEIMSSSGVDRGRKSTGGKATDTSHTASEKKKYSFSESVYE